MDATAVLKNFMDKCSNRADYLQYSLSSNSALEWFGRTFRGSKKIEQYYRYDIWPQYEQYFSSAVACDAFETKPSHLQTREKPIENSQEVACTKITPSKNVYETPPQKIQSTESPPPLTRGKRFRRLSDDVEPSAKKADKISKPEERESTINESNETESCGKLNDPEPNKKNAPKVTSPDGKESTSRKRGPQKVDCSTKRPKTETKTLEYFCEKQLRSHTPTIQSTSNSSAPDCSVSNVYSELKYIEAIGTIRTIRRQKHPGINKVPSTSTSGESFTPLISPESQNGWDRKTKLKISYRLGITNNDIQYALIIYEPLTIVFRRNLMEEFQQAAASESQKHKNQQTKSKSKTAHLRKDKLASLRRLRF